MRKAFSMIELIFVMVIISIMAVTAIWYLPRTELKQATEYLINNLKYTKTLAQLDDRYYTMSDNIPDKKDQAKISSQIQNWKSGLWQLQFHRGNGNTSASNSYTIYADQAKNGNTNDFDGIPNSGDLIARDPINKACLSGYSLSNLQECENNFAKEVKLQETYQTTIANIISIDCQYNPSQSFAIHFDGTGIPYCKVGSAQKTPPKKLTGPIMIELNRRGQSAIICISKGGIIEGSNTKNCPNT
ncbi:Tfp pilus assembly protein FimT/FimU [Helicobacter sp. MIT 14-3879]|uniref:pilus assembly FimT family protein n=1 Tax=Helicobacter sp. MIT 14-3879 TaxID=2040649 RepID=UPI000E1F64E6|nr:type II secretion system protein [Helicobacter sp. MIT 14-3879]RDU65160.1 hypothetical protein CQA44_02280 [Helicobacter sp. MIT 14-3879]